MGESGSGESAVREGWSILQPNHQEPYGDSSFTICRADIVPGTQLYRHLADAIRQQNPSLAYTAPKASVNSKTKPSKAVSKSKAKQTASAPPRTASRPLPPPNPVPVLEDRLPLHSPVYPTGVALSSIKRDLENEKEAKKKGVAPPGEEGKEKAPKMKRVVVRGGKR